MLVRLFAATTPAPQTPTATHSDVETARVDTAAAHQRDARYLLEKEVTEWEAERGMQPLRLGMSSVS